LKDQRAILCQSHGFEMMQSEESQQREPVQSPIVNAMIFLYSQPASQGVISVMYAPAGQGKTFGARTLLEHFYAFPAPERRIYRDSCLRVNLFTKNACLSYAPILEQRR
jgi:hypothetical protein